MSEPRKHLDLEPDTVERDLIKLVLTVVELLRQLMERQALRRVDEGDLSEEQEERIGLTLMLLDDRMTELRDRYGLRPEDLNLDLGRWGRCCPGVNLPEPERPLPRESDSRAAASSHLIHHLCQRPLPPRPSSRGRGSPPATVIHRSGTARVPFGTGFLRAAH